MNRYFSCLSFVPNAGHFFFLGYCKGLGTNEAHRVCHPRGHGRRRRPDGPADRRNR